MVQKMKNAGLTFILIMTLLCSCSKEIDNLFNISKIEFILENPNGPNSPGEGGILESDFKTGVFINELSEYPLSELSQRLVVENMPFINSNGLFTGDKLYLDKDKRYSIKAYAPFVEGINSKGDEIPFEHGTDVIMASTKYPADDQSIIVNQVKLDYVHLLSKAGFCLLDERDSISKKTYDFEKAHFAISGFCKRFFLNLNTGKITSGDIDRNVKITDENRPVCFAPSALSSTYDIIITIPPRDSLSIAPQTIMSKFVYGFKPGYAYNITIGVNTSGINISGDIVNWEAKVSDDLDLE